MNNKRKMKKKKKTKDQHLWSYMLETALPLFTRVPHVCSDHLKAAKFIAGYQWFMPVILATQEAETGKILV
jgi:hypothetical protein